MSDVPSGTVIDIRVDSIDVTSTKTATLTISSGSMSYILTIEQGAASKYITLNPTSFSFAYGGGSSTLGIDVNSDLSWSASSNQSWLTLSPTSGTGARGITVTAGSNSTTSSRPATITVSASGVTSKTASVTQDPKPYLTVSPLSVSTTSAAKYNGSVSVSSNTAWTVSTNVSWITLTSGTSGSNSNSDYRFEVAANTSTSGRSATITFKATDCTDQVVNISQAGVPYTIDINPATATVGYAAGSGSFTVSSNGSWTIGNYTTSTATKNGDIVNYTYPQNDDIEDLTYRIPVYCTADATKTKTFVLTQNKATISVSSSTLTLGGASGSSASSITVTSSGS